MNLLGSLNCSKDHQTCMESERAFISLEQKSQHTSVYHSYKMATPGKSMQTPCKHEEGNTRGGKLIFKMIGEEGSEWYGLIQDWLMVLVVRDFPAAILGNHKAISCLLIGCPWVLFLPRTACSVPENWNLKLRPSLWQAIKSPSWHLLGSLKFKFWQTLAVGIYSSNCVAILDPLFLYLEFLHTVTKANEARPVFNISGHITG